MTISFALKVEIKLFVQENDAPEVAVARLFASVNKNGAEYNYGHLTHTQCLQQLPSEREAQVGNYIFT